MTDKPTTADGYPPELAVEARRMCLFVATILGDLLDDVVVVGGLVPYLLIDQANARAEGRHVSTRDLDLGLALALLNEERYREIAQRLRDRGFQQATNDNPARGLGQLLLFALGHGHLLTDPIIATHGEVGRRTCLNMFPFPYGFPK